MLGPLPYFHRTVVIVAVLITAMASGAWVAHFTLVPIAVGAGAVLGGMTGLLVAYALVHASTRVHQPARLRRR
jgi:hypothetical protein